MPLVLAVQNRGGPTPVTVVLFAERHLGPDGLYSVELTGGALPRSEGNHPRSVASWAESTHASVEAAMRRVVISDV